MNVSFRIQLPDEWILNHFFMQHLASGCWIDACMIHSCKSAEV